MKKTMSALFSLTLFWSTVGLSEEMSQPNLIFRISSIKKRSYLPEEIKFRIDLVGQKQTLAVGQFKGTIKLGYGFFKIFFPEQEAYGEVSLAEIDRAVRMNPAGAPYVLRLTAVSAGTVFPNPTEIDHLDYALPIDGHEFKNSEAWPQFAFSTGPATSGQWHRSEGYGKNAVLHGQTYKVKITPQLKFETLTSLINNE